MDEDHISTTNLEHVSSTLEQGIESCRTIISDYRFQLGLLETALDTASPGDTNPDGNANLDAGWPSS
jgi:hypothetical protein